jgi:YVTN family beta-propeller protein
MTCAVLAGCSALVLLISVSLAGAKAAGGPKAYVGLVGDNAVAVLDTANNHVLGTIPVPAGPHGLVMTPDDSRVYLSSEGASTVSIIDTTSDQVTGSLFVGPSPHGLAITPDGSSVLVAIFGGDLVSAIDTATNEVVWSVPVTSPHNLAISPDGLTAYVASQDSAAPSLTMLNVPDHHQADRIPLDHMPMTLTFTPDGKQLWFTEAGVDELQVLDSATNAIVGTISVGAGPSHVVFTSTGLLGLVVGDAGGVALLDPPTGTSLASLTLGLPGGVAASADGLTAYVTDQRSNQLSVVDLTTASETDTVAIGAAAREIVLQSAGVPAAPVWQDSTTAPGAPPPAATLGAAVAELASTRLR